MHQHLIFFICFLFLFIRKSTEETIVRQLKERVHHLSKVIASLPVLAGPCNDSAFIIITEIPFGNSGNNIIEFIHGLWLSKAYNYTFVVPPWIRPALHPFNISIIHQHFCFSYIDAIPPKSTVLEITSEDSFFLFKIFRDRMYNASIPPFSEELIHEMSYHFIAIYTALWSYPSHHLLNAAAWLIEQKLGNSFNYTSIHKRSLEGGCNKLFSFQSQPSDFSPNQLDMNHPSWHGNLKFYHPICEMPASFALSTIKINNRSSTKYFLAYDGRGSIDDYISLNTTLSSNLDNSLFPEMQSNHAKKFLDMFMAINGDFFVLNPYSTYSFQIYVIRVCLGLESVPVMFERDIYFKRKHDYASGQVWVSWLSIRDTFERIKNKIWRPT